MKQKKVKIGSDSLYMLKTDRFRTITIRVILKEKVKKESITKRNFLASMLIDSCQKYPTRRELSLKAEDLYNVSVSSASNRTGSFSNTNIVMNILNEKYTEPGMYEQSIEFLSEILFHPNIKDGAFDQDAFDFIKKNAYKAIQGMKEKTGTYSMVRMLENLGDGPYSYRDTGYLEDLETITSRNLAEFYQEWMRHCHIDIYVIGNIDFNETEKFIKRYFEIMTYKHEVVSPYLEEITPRRKKQEIIERDDLGQSKLTIGCVIDPVHDFELNYVWNIYTIMLGASPDSKFFQNIREKYSVAYYVTASMKKLDHLMILKAGIDEANFKKTVKLMEQEMKEMALGHFSEDDILKAKKIYQTALDETVDSPAALIEAAVATDLLGVDPIDVRREKIMEVTKEQIMAFAKKVHVDTIYLLAGKETSNEED